MLTRFVLIASLLLSASLSRAADVQTDVSTRETFVGLPIVLQIHINNSVEHDPPELPEVDGLVIESAGPPSRSSRVTIINGQRRERSTVTYSFRVTPQREGTFTIPPVKIVADGNTSIIQAVRIVASKSETNDLMFAEIEGKDTEIYVGESLELTLRIWLRPYRDKDFQVTFDEGDMWTRITSQTNWGLFTESLQVMAHNRQRPDGRRVLREDTSGQPREYFLYEVDAKVYPDRPGQIDADDVRIVVDYPLQLGRRRSPFMLPDFDDFFGSLDTEVEITRSRPIVAETKVEPITVKPIPEQGRPDNYRGAVGQYWISTEAKPTRVKVGDPITLHLVIEGNGPMDVVRAPPLELQTRLTSDFKVPDEPLAGVVDGSRKVFTTTIRALRAGVREIPAIELSYFDPRAEKYVTTASQSIPIEVEAADVLALDAIVGGSPAAADRPRGSSAAPVATGDEETAEAGADLFADPGVLQSVPRPAALTRQLVRALILPPLLALAIAAWSRRRALGQLLSARRRCLRSLAAAHRKDQIADALECYLAARFQLQPDRLTRDQTIGRLRASGQSELAVRAERLYANCHKASFGSSDERFLEGLRAEAIGIVDDLSRQPRADRWRAGLGRISTTGILAAMIVPSAPAVHANPGRDRLELSAQQQRSLLDEAIAAAEAARAAGEGQSAQPAWARAADRFQLLVDSGIANDRLLYNLATSQLHAGRYADSIANFRRALRLDPTSRLYHGQLELAQRKLGATVNAARPGLEHIRRVNDVVLRYLAPRVMKGIAVAAWLVLWCVIALRLLRVPLAWKSAASATLVVTVLAAGSYFLRVAEYARDDVAVLTSPAVSVRQGDGLEFPEIRQVTGVEGRAVTVLQRRGDWLRIGLDDGTAGWVGADAAEEI